MNKLKLQWKIFGFILGFCFLLFSMLWIFQIVFLSDMYKFIRKGEIEKAIILVEENINSHALEDVLYELELTKEITVRPTKDFVPNVRPNNRYVRRQGETITKVEEFVLDDGGEISLTFYAFITPVDATVSTLKVQLFIITGIMVFFAILLAIIISKRISKPIEQINESAKMLSIGNYEVDFKGEGYLEIKELADTLNIAAKELSKVELLRRELIANISHDLRTPLALIYSYSEMMHDFPNEIIPDQIQVVMDETKRLTSLVNDVLDISNFETGKTEINKVRFNITKSLEKTIKLIQELVKSKGFQLDFKYDKDVYIFGDEVKILQAIYNLLLNAITHSDDSKIVIVNQIIKGNIIRIEVTDYGEGIMESDLPHIWERYYKVDKKHNRPITGTGLGLSIVKKIIDMHNVNYGVESKVGEGSKFWFSLNIDK